MRSFLVINDPPIAATGCEPHIKEPALTGAKISCSAKAAAAPTHGWPPCAWLTEAAG